MTNENKFARAKQEIKMSKNIIQTNMENKKETKKTNVFMLTPTDKNNFKLLAESSGMSMSSLLAYWINREMNENKNI